MSTSTTQNAAAVEMAERFMREGAEIDFACRQAAHLHTASWSLVRAAVIARMSGARADGDAS